MVLAPVAGVCEQEFLRPCEPLLLDGQGLLEREPLEAHAPHLLVVRVGAVDRVSQEHDELGVRNRLRHPPRDGRVIEVVRGRLRADEVLPASRARRWAAAVGKNERYQSAPRQ